MRTEWEYGNGTGNKEIETWEWERDQEYKKWKRTGNMGLEMGSGLRWEQEDVEPPARCVPNTDQWHQGSAGLCPLGLTGDHPAWILPWGMELEQRTKIFPHLGHSQGFPQWCLCWCRVKAELCEKLFPHSEHS